MIAAPQTCFTFVAWSTLKKVVLSLSCPILFAHTPLSVHSFPPSTVTRTEISVAEEPLCVATLYDAGFITLQFQSVFTHNSLRSILTYVLRCVPRSSFCFCRSSAAFNIRSRASSSTGFIVIDTGGPLPKVRPAAIPATSSLSPPQHELPMVVKTRAFHTRLQCALEREYRSALASDFHNHFITVCA